MKIKKTFQGELPENRIVNTYSNSLTDAYSANYLNDKLRNVEVSSTEPTNGKDIWVQMGKNLFDKNRSIISGMRYENSGAMTAYETGFCQETYISVQPNTSYVFSTEGGDRYRVCEYDKDKNYLTRFIPDTAVVSCVFTTGPSTKFIRVSGTISTLDSLQIEQGEFKTDYEPYMPKKIYVKKDEKYELVYDEANTRKEIYVGPTEPKSGEEVWVKKSNNLFPGWNVGRHYGSSNGTLTLNTDNSSTDLIPVDFTTNNKYTFSNFPTNSNIYISAFDSKGVYIGRTASGIKSEYTFTPDKLSSSGAGSGDANDIKYIAVTYQGTDVTDNTMLNMGGDVLPYEPHIDKKIYAKNDNGVYEEFYKNNGIVESGSNSKGDWVKFADGTMMCTVEMTVSDQAISYQYGNTALYYGVRTWTFPQPFTEVKSVNCGCFKWGTGASWGSVNAYNSTEATLMGYDMYSRAAGSCKITATATGKWK